MTSEKLLRTIAAAQTVSIVGICKNAGKTTVLNAILRGRGSAAYGLSSIGFDGEETDHVTGRSKPGIQVRQGDLAATAEGARCDATREILYATGVLTPMGEVVIFRALTGGNIELCGPSDVRGLGLVRRKLLALGADKVLIDGAAGRIASVSGTVCDGVILSISAAFDPRMEVTVGEAERLCKILTLPGDRCGDGESRFYHSGPLTDQDAKGFLAAHRHDDGAVLVAEGPSSVFLSSAMLVAFTRHASLRVRRPAALLAVTMNAQSPYGYSYEKAPFRRRLEQVTGFDVFDAEDDNA